MDLSALELMRKATAENDPFEVAILDMHMPGMDGLELAREIASDPDIATVRIVMLTSVSHRDGRDAGEACVQGYLSKPVRKAELHDCLVDVMGTPLGHLEPWDSGDAKPGRGLKAEGLLHGRLLLVEDNATNDVVCIDALKVLGCRVDVVTNERKSPRCLSTTTI